MPNPVLTDAAKEALRGAVVDGCSVRLPDVQLPRKVYEEVNTVLTRIGGGGKWNRAKRAHLFPRDPGVELAALLAEGAMPVDQDKLVAFFRTPLSLAERMVALAGVEHLPAGALVLEPSAGDGAIADVIRAVNPTVRIECVEPDEYRATELNSAGHVVHKARFQAVADSLDRPTAILMNPPFTEPGDRNAWATHIELALDLLASDGRLVAIAPNSFASRRGIRFDELRSRVLSLGRWHELPGDTFKASGTGVHAVLIEAGGAIASPTSPALPPCEQTGGAV